MALGARVHSGLVLGFGVTILAIDLFTRYDEHFWETLPNVPFSLTVGALLFGLELGMERALSRKPRAAA